MGEKQWSGIENVALEKSSRDDARNALDSAGMPTSVKTLREL
ncbi:hypothetical protein [Yokenella regensburgei]|nr:hypothetical protein [Yokenella regensburgei]